MAPHDNASAHLFFSYAHLDYDRLIDFLRLLEVRTGRKVWIDRIVLQRDAAWADMIERAIAGSYGVIFAVTRTFADEPNRPFIHQKEIPWARERFNDSRQGKLLFPIRFDDVPLPAALTADGVRSVTHTIDAFGRLPDEVIAELAPHLPEVPEARASDQPFVISWSRLRNFKGRDRTLIDLHQKLFTEDGKVGIKTAGVHGTGGIGKTQLAVEYAYRYRFYFGKGVYWLNAAADWKQEIAACADHLGLQPADTTDKDDRAGQKVIAFKEYLKGLDGEALIVLDNVDNPDSVLLREVAPKLTLKALCDAGRARLLITTRVQTLPDGFGAIAVSKLDPEDALAVLRDAWQPDEPTSGRADLSDEGALRAIATLFDYLPLPLGWMAAAL